VAEDALAVGAPKASVSGQKILFHMYQKVILFFTLTEGTKYLTNVTRRPPPRPHIPEGCARPYGGVVAGVSTLHGEGAREGGDREK
jgi:hypothetical protein